MAERECNVFLKRAYSLFFLFIERGEENEEENVRMKIMKRMSIGGGKEE